MTDAVLVDVDQSLPQIAEFDTMLVNFSTNPGQRWSNPARVHSTLTPHIGEIEPNSANIGPNVAQICQRWSNPGAKFWIPEQLFDHG